jgi:hypothetical protein
MPARRLFNGDSKTALEPLRLVNESDALMATEKFAAKFSKVRDEFVRTMDAYRATGGDVAGLLAASEAGRKLADLSRVLAPATEEEVAAAA